jgi:hypothetical protein
MPKKSKPKVTAIYDDSQEMGEILIDGESEFLGNYWDFHPGCSGTQFRWKKKIIDLKGIWKENVTPIVLANLIAAKIGGTAVKKNAKIEV